MKQLLILEKTKEGILEAEHVFKNVKKININYQQENFIVLALDTKNIIIKSEIIFKGGLNCCVIDPKTIFKFALENNANSLIVAHNHPSGDLTPSEEDKKVFSLLKAGGEILKIKVLDSVIFNKTEFYSLHDEI